MDRCDSVRISRMPVVASIRSGGETMVFCMSLEQPNRIQKVILLFSLSVGKGLSAYRQFSNWASKRGLTPEFRAYAASFPS